MGGRRTQLTVLVDTEVETSGCVGGDLALPFLRSLLTWTGYDSMKGCSQTLAREKTNPGARAVPPVHCTIAALLAASSGEKHISNFAPLSVVTIVMAWARTAWRSHVLRSALSFKCRNISGRGTTVTLN